jgi:hypothetical protein
MGEFVEREEQMKIRTKCWMFGLAVTLAWGAEKKASIPRMPDGHPDLSGIWNNSTLTPVERPRELAGKEFFTEQEAAAFERKAMREQNRDRRDGPAEADVARAYNEAWFDRGTKVLPSRRTSMVVDPPDGRIPRLTPEAQKAEAARAAAMQRPANGPEDRLLRERCMIGDNAGPPMLPAPYNNNLQIVQTRDSLAIVTEMIHDVRMIPLDGRPHLEANVRQWLGDSRGRWEGGTLVVDTTNFSGKSHFRGADQNMHLVERFTMESPGMIRYQFTIDDPTAFTSPWSGELALNRTEGPIYEYACHEGNIGMEGILAGARAEEKKARP